MIDKLSLTVLVLTYNEEIHLERCLKSVQDICSQILIVDSFSTDKTEAISKKFNAKFIQNIFINHADQINWGIENGEINTDWVIRIDADEYLSKELANNLLKKLPNIPKNISGVRVNRLMYFLDKPLKKAGMYPIRHLKLWRNGAALCEQRWMDERMKLNSGDTTYLDGDLVDHNLNKLTWWTDKHNKYATREAIDILDKLFNFSNSNVLKAHFFGDSEERRRWFKERYLKLPLFVRPFLFWFIRYVVQGGFLEGERGFIWNVLQCGWYRFLVDVKIYEAYKYGGKNRESLIKYFKDEYGYDVTKVG